jgi:hypothetical protein
MPYFPTPSIWTMRTIKGSALTHVELDDNQKMLNTKINDTEGVNLGPGPYFYVGKNKNADDGHLLFRSFVGLSGVTTYVSGSSIVITSSSDFCNLPDGIAVQELRNCDCSVNQMLGYCGCGTIGLSTSGVTFNPNSADKYTFPCYDGPANFHLCTDGAGQLSWCAGGSGSGGTSGDTYVSNVTFNDDDLCITRSDGQVWCVDFSAITPYEYGTGFNSIQPRKPAGSNVANALVSNIGGGSANTVFNTAKYSNIGGGHINRIRSEDGFIGGGESNVITAFATNEIGATTATTEFSGTTYRGASTACTHSCCYSADTSGYTKTTTYTAHTGTTVVITPYSAVSYNSHNSVIGGGFDNKIYGSHSFIGGGLTNEIYQVEKYKTQFFGVTITSTPYLSHEYSAVTSFTGVTTGCTATGQTFSGITFTGLTDTGYTVTRIEYTGMTYEPVYSVIGGGRLNIISGSTNTIIGGGKGNKVLGPDSNVAVLAGGLNQSIWSGSNYSFLGGGISNEIQHGAPSSVIVGGQNNKLLGHWNVSNIANPDFQRINSYSIIVGGFNNSISGGTIATGNIIVGGLSNQIMSTKGGFIGGGRNNLISASTMSFIGSGYRNIISGLTHNHNLYMGNVIAGGVDNKIYGGADGRANAIGGGRGNTITGNTHSTIGGGYQNTISFSYGFEPKYNTIGGGYTNQISGASYATIAGGVGNRILRYDEPGGGGLYDFIGAGLNNTIKGGVGNSAIIGGQANELASMNSFMGTPRSSDIRTDTRYSTILNGGGIGTGANIISGGSYYTTIINGSGNTITQNAGASVVLGTINRQANEPFTVFTNGLDVFTDVKDSVGATFDMKYFRYRGRLANEQAGRWLKCVDNEGNAVWDDINMPSTGSTDILLSAYTSGCTLYLEFTQGLVATADTCNLITPYRYGAGVNSIEPVQDDNYVHGGSTAGSIGGGQFNKVTSHYGISSYDGRVGGGIFNELSGSPRSFIGGGFNNVISGKPALAYRTVNSTIVAGYGNRIQGAMQSSVVAGALNKIHTAGYSIIGAGESNTIGSTLTGTSYNSIVNGQENNIAMSQGFLQNQRQTDFGTILNGRANEIYGNSGTISTVKQTYSTILNGDTNYITGDTSNYTTLGNGYRNSIDDSEHAILLGGFGTQIFSGSQFGLIGNGKSNRLGEPTGTKGQPWYATIVNGLNNSVRAHGGHIMGGTGNTINQVATSSAIIGCNNLTATEPNTTYMCGLSAGVVSAHTIVANHIILSGVTATGKFTFVGDFLANMPKPITHPLNTEDVVVNVWNQEKQRIDAEIYYYSGNQIRVAVSSDMSNVKVVIIG